jgi:hypothetical protein
MDNKKEPEQTNAEATDTGKVGQPVVVTDGELEDSDLAKVSGGSAPVSHSRTKTADKAAATVDAFIRG